MALSCSWVPEERGSAPASEDGGGTEDLHQATSRSPDIWLPGIPLPLLFLLFSAPGLPRPAALPEGAGCRTCRQAETCGTEPADKVWGLRARRRRPVNSIPQLTSLCRPNKGRRELSQDAKNESSAHHTCRDRISLNPGRPGTWDPPASVSKKLDHRHVPQCLAMVNLLKFPLVTFNVILRFTHLNIRATARSWIHHLFGSPWWEEDGWALRGSGDVTCDSSFVGSPWWEEDGLGSERQRSGDVACASPCPAPPSPVPGTSLPPSPAGHSPG
ncbi:uncharacterized protein [Marmota flaviventris]|uniref:uncharacterized protein n=1 Tax=Marmota flaviventris TaxID=93162 RepID=UPI003A8BD71B